VTPNSDSHCPHRRRESTGRVGGGEAERVTEGGCDPQPWTGQWVSGWEECVLHIDECNVELAAWKEGCVSPSRRFSYQGEGSDSEIKQHINSLPDMVDRVRDGAITQQTRTTGSIKPQTSRHSVLYSFVGHGHRWLTFIRTHNPTVQKEAIRPIESAPTTIPPSPHPHALTLVI